VTLEDGSDRFSRNVGKELPQYVISQKSAVSTERISKLQTLYVNVLLKLWTQYLQ
jgi:hypothetical protein